jgi:hypothetical protein
MIFALQISDQLVLGLSIQFQSEFIFSIPTECAIFAESLMLEHPLSSRCIAQRLSFYECLADAATESYRR